MKAALALAAWFGGAVLIVTGGMTLLFALGVMGSVPVLFYRGLVLIAVSEATCLLALLWARRVWPGWHVRDAISACALAGGISLCVLIVLPVTIDRSVSVFLLGRMAQEPDRSFSAGELSRIFVSTYVGRLEQVQRRMDEQVLTGNIIRAGDGYRIAPQGRHFIALSRGLGLLFQADPRFAWPPADEIGDPRSAAR